MKTKLLTLALLQYFVLSIFAGNVITYTASSKLSETKDTYSYGLHTNVFNARISQHTFSNGKGTITFSAEVTSIGNNAFYGCSSLTSITIPNSVTGIGGSAFSHCSSLTTITIPNSVTSIGSSAFEDCSGLTSVAIGNSVTSINNSAFRGCSGLTSITIPNSVTSIGYYAFSGCSGLTAVTIGNSVTSIGGSAFSECSGLISITIPNGVTSIGYEAFKGCSSLTTITIPNSVTSIGDYAFYRCSSLTSVTVPNSVTSIGEKAFSGCSGLTSVTIPNSVTSIGYEAFYGCTSLTSVHVSDLAAWCAVAFSASSNPLRYAKHLYLNGEEVTTLTIPNGVTSIGDYAFEDCSGLTSVTIPNSVTSIGNYAFRGCTKLTSVTIPNSVTSISNSAFSHCSSLTTITIPNSVTSIGSSAFEDCSGLTSVAIGNSVTSIGNYAFSGCSGLTSVTIPNSVTSIGTSAFYNVLNIIYSGTATGSPWGAKHINGFVDGYLIYADATKTDLLACSTSAIGEIIIPNSVTSIGVRAFYGCSGLTSVTIGNSVTSIGGSAFEGCSGLTSVTIGNSVTSIGNYAFRGCTKLTSIVWNAANFASPSGPSTAPFYDIRSQITSFTFGDIVKTIPNYLCYAMSSLDLVSIPQNVTNISTYAFESCTNISSIEWNAKECASATSYSKSPFYGTREHVSSFTFGDSVKAIPDGLCYGMINLDSLVIPESTTSIGKQAFHNCTGLNAVTLGNSVETIGASAFNGCSSLTSITIPNSVTSIGDGAFLGCRKLTKTNYTGTIAQWCAIDFASGISNPIYYSKNLYINDVLQTDIVIPNSVTSIGNYAFYCCSSLTSVTIPNSVTSIGYDAFYGCSGLTSVTIGNSVTSIGGSAFYGCSGLTSVTIPNSVTSIGEQAFRNCSGLTSVTIGNSVTSIGGSAFYGCSGLTSVTIPNSVTSIGEQAFRNCSGLTSVTIPNSVTSIGSSAFYDCSGLTSVTIGNSVTNISTSAFTRCSSLTSVVWNASNYPSPSENYNAPFYQVRSQINSFAFGDSVITIPDYLCYAMSGLDSVSIPHNVTNISTYAFDSCTNISSIEWNAKECASATSYSKSPFYGIREHVSRLVLGNKVVTIPDYLCYGMTNLDSLVVPESTTTIGKYAFYNCTGLNLATIGSSVETIGDYAFYGATNLDSLVIPESTTSIGKYAFKNCTGLNAVTLGSSVETIGDYAFQGCNNRSFTKLSMPQSVKKIGSYAFADCNRLTSVVFSSNLEEVGDYAFSGCTRVNDMTCYAAVTPDAYDNTFKGVNTMAYLYVQAGAARTYKLDPIWGVFDIKEIGADSTIVSGNNVEVIAADNEAAFTWPMSNNASTYALNITKDGVVFCTLTFSANGQLTNIAFAPSRDGAQHAPAATLTGNGYQFTVTGLDYATHYAFSLDAKDATSKVVASYSGYFHTNGATALEDLVSPTTGVQKIFRDGQVLILRDGVIYDTTGRMVEK